MVSCFGILKFENYELKNVKQENYWSFEHLHRSDSLLIAAIL